MRGLIKNAGFSLVELMVVVGIIGILAAVAVPKLQMFSAKAKRTEAQATLKHVHVLQTSYYVENSVYGKHTDIGYTDANLKNYEVTVNEMTRNVYNAVAMLKTKGSLCPGQRTGTLGEYDAWYVGDCPAGVSNCDPIINLVRTMGINPNFSLNGAPQPADATILSSCR